MIDLRDIDRLKVLSAGFAAPENKTALYHQAFRGFGPQALWSRRPSAHPTITQALVVAQSLRREGCMKSRPLAARIEAACRAAL